MTGQYLAINCRRCGRRTHRARGALAYVDNPEVTVHRIGDW